MTDGRATSPGFSGRRAKLTLIFAPVVLAAIVLGAWTQSWFSVTISDGQLLEVGGEKAAPALSALALSQLVLLGALAIAGPFFRVVLAVIQALIGFTLVLSAVIPLRDPVAASESVISDATAVAGHDSVAQLVRSVTAGPFAAVTIVAGVLIVVAAVGVLATTRSWPGSSRKYQALRTIPAGSGEGVDAGISEESGPIERNAVDDWDALSGGNDPTSPDHPGRS